MSLPVPSARKRTNVHNDEPRAEETPSPATEATPEPANTPVPFPFVMSEGEPFTNIGLDVLVADLPDRVQAALDRRDMRTLADLMAFRQCLPILRLEALSGDLNATIQIWRSRLEWGEECLRLAQQNVSRAEAEAAQIVATNEAEQRQAQRDGRPARLIHTDPRSQARSVVTQINERILPPMRAMVDLLEQHRGILAGDKSRLLHEDKSLTDIRRAEIIEAINGSRIDWNALKYAGGLENAPPPPQI